MGIIAANSEYVIAAKALVAPARMIDTTIADPRSEEHTSELQSQSNLVCRLLLEKKNNNTFSCLVGEIEPRASGESIGPFFKREVPGRVGMDFNLGFSPSDSQSSAGYVLWGWSTV